MVELDPQVLTVIALVAVVVALLALVAAVTTGLRLRGLRRELGEALGGEGASVVEVLGRHNAQLDAVRSDIGELGLRTEQLRGLLRQTVSKSALVRYDAFEDMGGALSFSAALLDEQGDGVVISAINGRSETRCYAKPIAQGTSESNLSGEEHAVIEAAMSGQPAPSPPVGSPGRRRRRVS